MITLCVLLAAKGLKKDKFMMAIWCLLVDSIYLIPCLA